MISPAFSPTRKAGRFAQATDSIPSFISTLPRTVRHFLGEFPAESLAPGDVLVTNDPWMGTGHLPDICVAKPVFLGGALLGFAASTAHAPDIGGPGPLPGGARDLRGRAPDPDPEAHRGGTPGRDPVPDPRAQRPDPRAHRGRSLGPGHRPRPHGIAASLARPRVRNGVARRALERDPRPYRGGDAKRDPHHPRRLPPHRPRDGRIRRAASHRARADDYGRAGGVRLRGHLASGGSGDQPAPLLHRGDVRLRDQVRGRPRGSQQRRLARGGDGARAGALPRQSRLSRPRRVPGPSPGTSSRASPSPRSPGRSRSG